MGEFGMGRRYTRRLQGGLQKSVLFSALRVYLPNLVVRALRVIESGERGMGHK
jgi:hypothetical protein